MSDLSQAVDRELAKRNPTISNQPTQFSYIIHTSSFGESFLLPIAIGIAIVVIGLMFSGVLPLK